MKYSNLTWETFKNSINELNAIKEDNSFTFLTGEKGAALFNLAVLNYANPMPPALYNLKCRAIRERAYVHPGWDYLKYPAVELEVSYSNLESNKIYDEELDDDGYPILVFVGRSL